MRQISTILFVVSLYTVAFAQGGETIILTIDGKEYTLEEGEELQLDKTLSSPTLSVRVADNKHFESRYLSFMYPKNFSYTYDEDIGYRNWTLDGDDFVIMYFEMDERIELEDFVNEMVAQFGEHRCEITPTEIKLGEKTLKGTRIDVSLVGQRLSVDLVEIEGNEFKSRIIAFQDSIGDDGNASTEKVKTLDVIDQSIQYK